MGTSFPLSMPPPSRRSTDSCGAVPNQPQHFVKPQFVDKGIHKALGGDEEENRLDLQSCWVLPPSGLGAQLPNGLFVDGIKEDDNEAFSGMFNSILKLM
jgi:hypothetical protein